MSELFEKIRDLKYLPVFPLPLVLFPNELLPLHIFEPRYKQMLDDVREGNNFFGVSYFDLSESLTDLPEIGSLGCLAEIRDVQTTPDGRSNILTLGLMRYEITGYLDLNKPYLVAEINFFEDFKEDEEKLESLSNEVFDIFRRIAKAAQEISGEKEKLPEITRFQPETLSFLIAAAFNLDLEIKNKFLKIRSTSERLSEIRRILEQAVEKVEESLKIHKISKTNGHSKKKINLD